VVRRACQRQVSGAGTMASAALPHGGAARSMWRYLDPRGPCGADDRRQTIRIRCPLPLATQSSALRSATRSRTTVARWRMPTRLSMTATMSHGLLDGVLHRICQQWKSSHLPSGASPQGIPTLAFQSCGELTFEMTSEGSFFLRACPCTAFGIAASVFPCYPSPVLL